MTGKKTLLSVLAALSVWSLGMRDGLAADVKARTIKYAVLYDMDHPHGIGAKKFADIVKQKSDGKITVKIYPSATLGGEVPVISALQGGVVEMSAIGTSALTGVVKEYAVWDFPFLFSDAKEADAVFDGHLGQKMMDRLPEKGLVGLTWFEHGFRQLTNSKRPVRRLEDIEGLKVRVQQNAVSVAMFNALGANAVPMPFPELYAALESKAVDAQENPFNSIEVAKFNEVQKYISVTNHTYTPMVLLMSKRFWDGLSVDEQKIIREAANEARPFQRSASRELNEASLQNLTRPELG